MPNYDNELHAIWTAVTRVGYCHFVTWILLGLIIWKVYGCSL